MLAGSARVAGSDADVLQGQNDDTAMDIDDDGTQRPAEVTDYGVKPDFDELDEEAKEVCPRTK